DTDRAWAIATSSRSPLGASNVRTSWSSMGATPARGWWAAWAPCSESSPGPPPPRRRRKALRELGHEGRLVVDVAHELGQRLVTAQLAHGLVHAEVEPVVVDD